MGLWPLRVISLSLVWLTREENGKNLFLVAGSSFLPLHPTREITLTRRKVFLSRPFRSLAWKDSPPFR